MKEQKMNVYQNSDLMYDQFEKYELEIGNFWRDFLCYFLPNKLMKKNFDVTLRLKCSLKNPCTIYETMDSVIGLKAAPLKRITSNLGKNMTSFCTSSIPSYGPVQAGTQNNRSENFCVDADTSGY